MADTYQFFEYEITRKRISAAKPAKKQAKREKVEEDEPAPRAKKAERLGYADLS
jgi:hypothetical protein